jgi:hypothetical protein
MEEDIINKYIVYATKVAFDSIRQSGACQKIITPELIKTLATTFQSASFHCSVSDKLYKIANDICKTCMIYDEKSDVQCGSFNVADTLITPDISAKDGVCDEENSPNKNLLKSKCCNLFNKMRTCTFENISQNSTINIDNFICFDPNCEITLVEQKQIVQNITINLDDDYKNNTDFKNNLNKIIIGLKDPKQFGITDISHKINESFANIYTLDNLKNIIQKMIELQDSQTRILNSQNIDISSGAGTAANAISQEITLNVQLSITNNSEEIKNFINKLEQKTSDNLFKKSIEFPQKYIYIILAIIIIFIILSIVLSCMVGSIVLLNNGNTKNSTS